MKCNRNSKDTAKIKTLYSTPQLKNSITLSLSSFLAFIRRFFRSSSSLESDSLFEL